ncbi:hypothetical protein DICPUDRAFT_91212 [Dictyostelium purpureum]|uniref:Uncharacterized protein n=1 Tax=Dictyostelium purpureum TaxID=5786 RepID=F0Z940_DICPU|nr:uncharacterized protein DICPUDRAFT_91212 [Dictyostelium purpureum]EGC39487.1 hypothetical protein DICPUDRAFT_91212 [Dictyostelium purpureum]|eukprot:XP_003283934.1 hypothetical protein DICPUDRAFT_91212 [Dictyostelium purpureum]
MLSPQHQSSDFTPLPAIKVGGEHGMRVPKSKGHKSSPHTSPIMTNLATAMDTTYKIENTDPKTSPVYPPKDKAKECSPTIQENHKNQQRPLNQPR